MSVFTDKTKLPKLSKKEEIPNMKFFNQEWTKGRYYDQDVEDTRKACIDAGVDINKISKHIGCSRQHLSSCLRGQYRLTPKLRAEILAFVNYCKAKKEHKAEVRKIVDYGVDLDEVVS